MTPFIQSPIESSVEACAPRLLTLNDLTLTWNGRPAVNRLNGELHQGDWLAVVGPNGAGKSTLLHALCGALAPTSGTVAWHGVTRAEIALLSQHHGVDRNFPMTVSDWLSLGLWRTSGIASNANHKGDGRRCMQQALAEVELQGFENRSLNALSGGQFQRLRFARISLMACRVVLLDEPFNAVDAHTTELLLRVLEDWQRSGRTLILVTHDLSLVRQRIPHTLLLARDPIAWGPTAVTLTEAHLARAWVMPENSPPEEATAIAPWRKAAAGAFFASTAPQAQEAAT